MNTAPAQTLELDSIDDYLGPAAQRFFGAGYQRIGYELAAEPVSRRDEQCSVNAAAALTYPADWSRKASGGQKPHLSTIDALVLGASAAGLCTDELMLSATGQPLVEQLPPSAAWIKHMRIKAGSKPHEDMGVVPVVAEARLQHSEQEGIRSAHSARIAGMTVTTDVVHPICAPDSFSASRKSAGGSQLYLDRLGDHDVSISEVEAEVEADRATSHATVTIRDRETAAPAATLEGAYPDSTTPVDAFVATLQLGQVLLYELDGITRSESDTLWMRQTEITASGPHRPHRDPLRSSTHLENTRLINRTNGAWRTADVVGHVGSITVRCAVAHKLA